MDQNNISILECTNIYRNIWVARWDIKQKINNKNIVKYTYESKRFEHLPTIDEIRDAVNEYYNKITDEKILKGFKWNDSSVWLSTENQFNYKATHDLAVQTGGKTLPVTFKLGEDDKPTYVTFNTVEEISAFYTAALAYIQKCYTDGWAQKDAFDYSGYEAIITAAKQTV